MRQNLALSPESRKLRIHAWPIPHLVPPAVFAVLIVLSQFHAAFLGRAAFWSWLVLVILDEVFARARLAPWPIAETPIGNALTRVTMPLFLAFLLGFANAVTSPAMPVQEFFAIAFICGVIGAIFAIPAAHELMHGKCDHDRISAVVIMSVVSYPHFNIAHLHSHHRHVATPEDPATARLGESLYGFFQRSIPGGIAGAWEFEARRLRRSGHLVWGTRNRFLHYAVLMTAIYGVFFGLFGYAGVAFLAIQSVAAVFTLETMNYVQHYGLQRRILGGGALEPVDDCHSWDTCHPVTNMLMLNLGHHSKHHQREIGVSDEAPRLPFGYFALFSIALLPPLWRRAMDPRVRALRRRATFSLSV